MREKHNQVWNLITILGLVSLVILPVFQTGCAGAWPSEISAEYNNPFYKDKVAILKIVMTPEDWDFCLEHAFEEQYVRAEIPVFRGHYDFEDSDFIFIKGII